MYHSPGMCSSSTSGRGKIFSPEPPGLYSTAASSMPLRISISLYVVACAAMVPSRPLTREPWEMLSLHISPSQTPDICAAQVPELSKWHCYNSAALCIVTACSEAAEPIFSKASAIFPLQFSCTIIFILLFSELCACKPQLHCFGKFSWEWEIGFGVWEQQGQSLPFIILFYTSQFMLVKSNHTAQQNR